MTHRKPTVLRVAREEELEAPGLRERKKARQREQIFETAIKLFRKNGYHKVRVDDIVRALDISQPTFFRYFASKDTVLREVGKRGFVRIVELQKYLLSTEGAVPERLCMLYTSIARDIEADAELWRAVVLAGGNDPLRSADLEFRRLERTQFRLLRDLISDGQQRGEVSQAFPVDHLAEFMEGLCATVVLEWASELNGSHDLSKRLRSAVEFFLRGVKP